jgi:hypothetical protein
MDFSDRLRVKRQTTIAAANVPSFTATWTTGQLTLTVVSGTPIVGTYVNATGLPNTAMVTNISGNTVTISVATTSTQSTATSVIMTPSSASAPLRVYDSYEEKYNTQGGLSYLTFATGKPVFASTIGAFGCEGQ